MSCKVPAAESRRRLCYRKLVDEGLQFVIVDLFPDGRAEFWSQEVGEVRWFSFSPSQGERTAALSLAGRSGDGGDWPLLPQWRLS